MIVPHKEITQYPNSKPWVDKQCRILLEKKAQAFVQNDSEAVKSCTRKFKKYVGNRKKQFSAKIDRKFQEGNPKAAWDGMKLLTGFENARKCKGISLRDNPSVFVENLNDLYCRFDCNDHSNHLSQWQERVKSSKATADGIYISADKVRKVLASVKSNKATDQPRKLVAHGGSAYGDVIRVPQSLE